MKTSEKSKLILEPLKLTPSKSKFLFLFLFSILIVLSGIFQLQDGKLIGYISIGLSGLGIIVFGIQLFTDNTWIFIDENGFTESSFFYKHKYLWKDIEEIGIFDFSHGLSRHTFVAFNLTQDANPKQSRKYVKVICAYEYTLRSEYGLPAKELLALMIKYKDSIKYQKY